MSSSAWLRSSLLASIASVAAVSAGAQAPPATDPAALAQQELPGPPRHSLPDELGRQPVEPYGGTEALLKTAVSNIFPGGISTQPPIRNVAGNDPASAQRGMQYFNAFNCVGCHAANGGGGIGPALSNRFFKYGSAPADIYLTIVQGRPEGMPAWGGLLPDAVIWDLVAYVTQISQAPVSGWGQTTSLQTQTLEQVPAEFETTPMPWAHTEPFSYGQAPTAPKRQSK